MAKRKSASTSAGNSGAAEHVVETRVAEEAVVAAAVIEPREPAGGAEQVLELDPDNVIIDPAIRSLRRWDGSSQQELRIPELARTISEEGQIEPCIVRETGDGYVLVAGHRRHAAVSSLRAAGEDVMLQVIVRPISEENALRQAMLENIQSEDFTGIEFAGLCKMLRERYKADGWDKKGSGTAAIAEHLGVSPATVTTHEKLLELPVGVQDDVQSGRLSVNAALELAGVADEARPDVLDKAQQLADKDAERRAENERKRRQVVEERMSGRGAKSNAKAGGRAQDVSVGTVEVDREEVEAETPAETKKPAPPAKVTGKHIRQAAKSVQGAAARVKAPKMGEAIDAFEGWISALYPAVMVDFSKTFSEWGHGRVGDRVLEKAWDAVADWCKSARAPMAKLAETTDEKVDRAYRKAGVRPKATVAVKKAKTSAKSKPTPKPAAKPFMQKGGKSAKKK